MLQSRKQGIVDNKNDRHSSPSRVELWACIKIILCYLRGGNAWAALLNGRLFPCVVHDFNIVLMRYEADFAADFEEGAN